jgi:hypothetical protein
MSCCWMSHLQFSAQSIRPGVGNRWTAVGVRTQLTSSPDRDTIATIILIMRFLFYIYNFHQEILTTNVWVTFINPLNTLN